MRCEEFRQALDGDPGADFPGRAEHAARLARHRTERVDGGILVDYGADGKPIGLEITAPASTTVSMLNAIMHTIVEEIAGEDGRSCPTRSGCC